MFVYTLSIWWLFIPFLWLWSWCTPAQSQTTTAGHSRQITCQTPKQYCSRKSMLDKSSNPKLFWHLTFEIQCSSSPCGWLCYRRSLGLMFVYTLQFDNFFFLFYDSDLALTKVISKKLCQNVARQRWSWNFRIFKVFVFKWKSCQNPTFHE